MHGVSLSGVNQGSNHGDKMKSRATPRLASSYVTGFKAKIFRTASTAFSKESHPSRGVSIVPEYLLLAFFHVNY